LRSASPVGFHRSSSGSGVPGTEDGARGRRSCPPQYPTESGMTAAMNRDTLIVVFGGARRRHRDATGLVMLRILAATAIFVSIATSAWSARPTPGARPTPLATAAPAATVNLDLIDARFESLEARIGDSVTTLSRLSDLSLQNLQLYTNYLTLGASFLGALGVLLGILGFREIHRVAEVREEAIGQLEAAKHVVREAGTAVRSAEGLLVEAVALSRAIPLLMRAEIATADKSADPDRRAATLAIHADEALRHLEEAIRQNPTPRLMNWKAYALKRLGHERYRDAIEAARVALETSGSGTYEHVRAAYNIACYRSLCGDVRESRDFLRKTIDMDQRYAAIARKDDDLSNVKRHADTAADVARLLGEPG
jgi:tetratricopeptide (TPR) repeat protein